MAPYSEHGLPLEYVDLKLKGKFKVWSILWRPEIEQELINTLQMKINVFCKTSNRKNY